MEKFKKETLKEKGYKATAARIAILEIFSKTKEPLDAKNVYKKISAKGGSASGGKNKKVNEATVYRTLASFENAGILKKVDLRKDSVYFELADEHHHHIVCTNCDRIEDFENKKIEKVLNKIAVGKSSKFKKINEHALELFGLCASCV